MGSFYSLPDPPTLHTRARFKRATRETFAHPLGAVFLTTANFEGGIDDGDMSPTKKTKIKRGRATPPRHKLPILFF